MKIHLLAVLILNLLFIGTAATGQDAATMPSPTKEHTWLEKFVGEWTVESKATMGPGQPPTDCIWKLSSKSLGGFWIVNEMQGDMSGTPVTCIQTIGFDERKKKHIGTWVDSVTSFMWRYEGIVDSTGKVLTLDAEGPNFMGDGKLTKFQDIYEFKSPNEFLISSRLLGTDGKWVTFMSGAAKRIK